MANEPERPIEKLLRAAARKRRDDTGAAFELHPATRRLLQGEVARKFAKALRQPRSFTEILGQMWPRFAWGVAIFAVLGVTVWMLLPVPGKGKPEALLAQNESVREAAPAKEPSPSARAAAAETPAPPKPARQLAAEHQPLMKDSVAAQTARRAKEQPASAPARQLADRKETDGANIAASGGRLAPAPAATVVAADDSATLTGVKPDQPALAYKSLAASAPANRPQSAPATTEGFAKSASLDQAKSKTTGGVQYFARVAPAQKAISTVADKATPAHPVLAAFQVQQTGEELRIVDGDGSVYRGYLRRADATPPARAAKAEVSAPPPASRAPAGVLEEKVVAGLEFDRVAPPTYSFRVAGTNRSLNQQVVFTGNLLAATNLALSPPATNHLGIGGGLGGFQRAPAQQGLPPLLNTRISGKVVIGSGKAVEINAVPASP